MNGTSVYAGVAYDGDGNVYADYNNSTEHLQVDDLLSRFIAECYLELWYFRVGVILKQFFNRRILKQWQLQNGKIG